MGNKKYSKEDILSFGYWYSSKEEDSYVIRRVVTLVGNREASERLPVGLWRKELENLETPQEIELALARICKKQNIKDHPKYQARIARKNIIERSPWITTAIRNEFRSMVQAQRKNLKDSNYIYDLFETKCLKFFLDYKKIKDPHEFATAQFEWGLSLMNKPEKEEYRLWEDKEYCPSKKTIETIVHVSNHFMDFLKIKDSKEYQNLGRLIPYTKSQMDTHEANRLLDDDYKEGKYLTPEDWGAIEEILQNKLFIQEELKGVDIYPFIKLSYEFGLRRSESLGILLEDIRRDCLSVERQLARLNNEQENSKPIYDIPKGKDQRFTPYWGNLKANDVYELVSRIGRDKCKLIHPDTLTSKWKVVMNYLLRNGKISHNYDIHDLRRTFITKALRSHVPVDVMQAVGHKNIETTMLYIVNERTLSTEVFKPKAS